MKITAAAVQMRSTPFAIAENLERGSRRLDEACDRGADLVVLPELFNVGYTYDRRLSKYAEPIDGPTTDWMRDQSSRRGIHLAACLVERGPFGCYDTLALTTPSGSMHLYRKRYPAFFEKLYFNRGAAEGVFHTSIGPDWGDGLLGHGSAPTRTRTGRRVDLLLISSAWPDMTASNIRLPFLDSWMTRQARQAPERLAARLDVPVVFANMAGQFHTRVPGLGIPYEAPFVGRSSITDHAGVTIRCAGADDEVILAPVDIGGPAKRQRLVPLRATVDASSRRAA